MLECNLIKEHRPKYNTMLKDDKTYPYICITVNEAYPRVLFSREMKRDKSKYFGPYTSVAAVKDIMDLLRKIYKIRTCNRNLPKDIGKERPCLYYYMGQCDAPCQGFIEQEAYRKNIDHVIDAMANMGLLHQNCLVDGIVVDDQHKVVTTPAYMQASRITEAKAGIFKLVDKVLAMA